MPVVIHEVAIPDDRLKRLPLIVLTTFFIGFVCIALFGLLALHLAEAKKHDLRQAGIASTNLARAMAQQAEDTFDEADLVLQNLLGWLQAYGHESPQKLRLHNLLLSQVQALPQLHGVFVFDAQGSWLISSFAQMPVAANVADRAYFKYHQSNLDLSPHIGAAIRSRENGEWVIPISRRINNAQGEFEGVVLAALNMSYFDEFFKGFDIDEHGAMLLALADGTLLARRPSVSNLIGASIANGEIFRAYRADPSSSTALITSTLDGQVRLAGYKWLSKYQLVVIAASSEKAILEEWHKTAFRTSLITCGVIVVIVLFGFLVIVQVKNGTRVEADLRSAQGTLELMATHDTLTGLANRRLLGTSFGRELKRGARLRRPLSLIMIDIDFFKSFNDTYGHIAGDQCLTHVAQTVQQCCQRPSDLAVRYGGEEFAVLLPETDAAGALVIAEQIRNRVADRNIVHSSNPLGKLTISLGCYTLIPTGTETITDVIGKADAALYEAKRSGRNQTKAFEPDPSPKV
ncbi:sensor domain-containing diguanylate cyclase [Pseudomonas sp. DWP3-1-2]|uniref:sensor domain-containing diguanylate cyclase n=1 Tax=Pseudomonas sp. DWP3-1-2 TaxID=2804645 RepID=UPI003CF968DD